jgi:hypothetical protein
VNVVAAAAAVKMDLKLPARAHVSQAGYQKLDCCVIASLFQQQCDVQAASLAKELVYVCRCGGVWRNTSAGQLAVLVTA